MRILSTKAYDKKFKKWKKPNPDKLSKYRKTISLMEVNVHHPSLRLHRLKGSLQEYYSISIDMKNRIIIDFIIRDDLIILIDIGSHKIY